MDKYFLKAFIAIFATLITSCQSSRLTSIEFSDGTYNGEIDKKGKKHGMGSYTWHDGSTYEGDFKNDFRHGNGLFKWSNGETYKGEYLEDQRTGEGVYRWSDGSFYEGTFLNGKRHGFGTYHSINGSTYEGEWFDDLQHGEGKLTHHDQSSIRGIWRNGKIITKPSILPEPATKPMLEEIGIPEQEIKTTTTTSEREINGSAQKIPPLLSNTPISSNDSIENPKSNLLEKTILNDPSPKSPEIINLEQENISNETEIVDKSEEEKTLASSNESVIWAGTVTEAENEFTTELINGIDTVSNAKTKIPFTGKMQILDQNGALIGEVNLLDGRLHGEEVFMDDTGAITEKNIWVNGVRQK